MGIEIKTKILIASKITRDSLLNGCAGVWLEVQKQSVSLRVFKSLPSNFPFLNLNFQNNIQASGYDESGSQYNPYKHPAKEKNFLNFPSPMKPKQATSLSCCLLFVNEDRETKTWNLLLPQHSSKVVWVLCELAWMVQVRMKKKNFVCYFFVKSIK